MIEPTERGESVKKKADDVRPGDLIEVPAQYPTSFVVKTIQFGISPSVAITGAQGEYVTLSSVHTLVNVIISDVVTIDIAQWSRYREVRKYAENRGITVMSAINQLVNSGLSHLL